MSLVCTALRSMRGSSCCGISALLTMDQEKSNPPPAASLGSFRILGVSPAPGSLLPACSPGTCPPWTAPGTPLGSAGLVAEGEGGAREKTTESRKGGGRVWGRRHHHGDQKAEAGKDAEEGGRRGPSQRPLPPAPALGMDLALQREMRMLRTREGIGM